MVSEKTKKILQHVSLAGVLLFIMLSLSQTIGLGRTGFDSTNVLQQFFFYTGPAVGFLLGILLFFIAELYISKGDNLYGDSVSFASPGESPAPTKLVPRGQFRLFLLSVIIFFIFGLYLVYTKQTFADVATLGKQQFTVLDSIIFSSALVPAAENLGAAFVWALSLFFIRSLCRRKNLSKNSFMIIAVFFAPVIFGLFGLFNHLLRYGNSDVALLYVIMFWAIGGIITVLSGSFIPFWILHLSNNLFVDLSKYYTNDIILVFTIASIIGIIIIYALLYLRRNKKEVT